MSVLNERLIAFLLCETFFLVHGGFQTMFTSTFLTPSTSLAVVVTIWLIIPASEQPVVTLSLIHRFIPFPSFAFTLSHTTEQAIHTATVKVYLCAPLGATRPSLFLTKRRQSRSSRPHCKRGPGVRTSPSLTLKLPAPQRTKPWKKDSTYR